MAGLEVLGFLISCFVVMGAGLVARVAWSEREKRLFLNTVATSLYLPMDVQSGDLFRPLTFSVHNVRVTAMLRGDVEVWQLEREDVRIDACAMALVHCDWHAAAEVRALPEVGALTPSLALRADDAVHARGFVAEVRAELASLLGRQTRQCVVGPGRAFLEVTRSGLAVEELRDALLRLDGLVDVLAGRHALLPASTPSPARAVAGPLGIPIPGLA